MYRADTLGRLVDEALLKLSGFAAEDMVTTLAVGVGDAARQLTVASAGQLTRGYVEVGDELMLVSDVDAVNSTVVVASRGAGGSTPAAHQAGELVRGNPRFPRAVVARAIDDAIESTWPMLFGVTVEHVAFSPAQTTYALGADVRGVLDVRAETVGPAGEWVGVRRWRYDRSSGAPSVTVWEGPSPGRRLAVTAMVPPRRLGQSAALFAASGLPASARDAVVLLACSSLITDLEPGRISTQSVSADMLDQPSPAGSATSAARWFLQQGQRRVAEVREALLAEWPQRIHQQIR
jgi:hypothetical protein